MNYFFEKYYKRFDNIYKSSENFISFFYELHLNFSSIEFGK